MRKRGPIMRVCIDCGAISEESRCPAHRKKHGWGDAHQRRPRRKGQSGWAEQKRNRRIMALHGGICHVCGQPGADQIDHLRPVAFNGGEDDDNLRPIHAVPCHREKTQAEAAAGRYGHSSS